MVLRDRCNNSIKSCRGHHAKPEWMPHEKLRPPVRQHNSGLVQIGFCCLTTLPRLACCGGPPQIKVH